MADAYEYRPHTLSGAENRADHLAGVAEGCPGAALRTGRAVLPGQSTLGASYGGKIAKDPYVAGDAEASRMSVSVPVTHHAIRRVAELPECGENGGRLPKG